MHGAAPLVRCIASLPLKLAFSSASPKVITTPICHLNAICPAAMSSHRLQSVDAATWRAVLSVGLHDKPPSSTSDGSFGSCVSAEILQALLDGEDPGSSTGGNYVRNEGQATLWPDVTEDQDAIEQARLWVRGANRAALRHLQAHPPAHMTQWDSLYLRSSGEDHDTVDTWAWLWKCCVSEDASACKRLLATALAMSEIENRLQHIVRSSGAGGLQDSCDYSANSERSDAEGGHMLLKDLLQHESVRSAVPSGMLAVLRFLFLPVGVNLRNLVWHGFLSPSEMPPVTAAVVLVALRELPRVPRRLAADNTVNIGHSLDPSIDSVYAALMSAYEVSPGDTQAAITRSGFVLPGFEELALEAFKLFHAGQPLLGALAATLILEQSLRRMFCVLNERPMHFFARTAAYYSTLDGFGQKSKHQLLLDPRLVRCVTPSSVRTEQDTLAPAADKEEADMAPNLLLEELGVGPLSCLLDLYMLHAGPGIRGKLAHGLVPLSDIITPYQACCRASKLVLLTFAALCWRYHPARVAADRAIVTGSDESTPSEPASGFVRGIDPLAECVRFVERYRPRFHPRAMLRVALRSAVESIASISIAMLNRPWRVVSESGAYEAEAVSARGDGTATLLIDSEGAPQIRVVDKAERMEAWCCCSKGGSAGGGDDSLVGFCLALQPWLLNVSERLGLAGVPACEQADGVSRRSIVTSGLLQASYRTAGPLSLRRLWVRDPHRDSESAMHDLNGHAELMLHPAQPDGLFSDNHEEYISAAHAPHVSLDSIEAVTSAGLPMLSCILQLCDVGIVDTARSLISRLDALEARIISREASSGQRRAYVQTLEMLPATYLLLTLAVMVTEAYALESVVGVQACGHQPVPTTLVQGFLKEIVSFRRCFGGDGPQRKSYAQAMSDFRLFISRRVNSRPVLGEV